MSRYAAISSFLYLVLFLAGCQPYPDHENPIDDFRAESVDFGSRRELRLIRVTGDRSSLLLEFNQPINSLDEPGAPAPFVPTFQPRVPVASVVCEGAASVRVSFSEELPPAQLYSATISAGWRALTGASFLRAERIKWNTETPALVGISCASGVANWQPSETIKLHFNQPVMADSLKDILTLRRLPDGTPIALFPQPVIGPVEEDGRVVGVSLPRLESPGQYQLSLAAGLKSQLGPLPGEESAPFLFGKRPDFTLTSKRNQVLDKSRTIALDFSEPVSIQELRKHIEGVDWTRARLTSEDQIHFRLFLLPDHGEKGSLGRLEILGSLRSIQGALMGRAVEVRFAFPKQVQAELPTRPFRAVAPASTVLDIDCRAESSLTTWELTPSQALSLMGLPDSQWEAGKKLPQELGKPVYSKTSKKAQPRTRFLKNDKLWTQKKPYGLFLLRESRSGKFHRRHLVMRTALSVEVSALADKVSLFVSRQKDGSAARGLECRLLDLKGKVRDQGSTDDKGLLSFSGSGAAQSRFVLARNGSDLCIRGFEVVEVTVEKSAPGLLWSDGSVFEVDSILNYFGLWWGKTERPSVTVRDGQGHLQEVEVLPVKQLGMFFRGSIKVPKEPGDYDLELVSGDYSTPRFQFAVTARPVLYHHPSELTLKEEDGRYSGSYTWQGPGASHLGVRAFITVDDSSGEGWYRVIPNRPESSPIEVTVSTRESGGTFELGAVPPWEGPSNLRVELFDTAEPERVYRRQVLPLREELLDLNQVQVRNLTPEESEVKFRFRFLDGDNGPERPLTCHLSLRAAGGSGEWQPVNQGEAIWKDGNYHWVSGIRGQGWVRLECRWGSESEPVYAFWESKIEGDAASQWESLKITDGVASPGSTLELSWPGLAAGTPVWLSLLSAEGVVETSRRIAGAGGSLETIVVPAMDPGAREMVVLASLGEHSTFRHTPRPSDIRANRVALADTSFFSAAGLEVEDEVSQDIEVEKGQVLEVRLDHEGSELHNGILWWEQHFERSDVEFERASIRDHLLNTTRRAGTTLHGTLRLPIAGPFELFTDQPLKVLVPEEPGSYRLLLLAEDEESRVVWATTTIEVMPSDRWSTLLPSFVRPGDAFAAGVRFWADPRAIAPTGVTTSVDLESTMLPVSYFATAALVDPGRQGDMLFDYRAPEFIAETQKDDFQMNWELGVEGQAWAVEAFLDPLPTSVRNIPYKQALIQNGAAFGLNLSALDRWKLRLSLADDGESATLDVTGAPDGDQRVALDRERPVWELVGQGGTFLAVLHQQGGAVEASVSQVEPNPAEIAPSAERLYLMRRFETLEGEPLEGEACRMGQDYFISYYLVVPEATPAVRILSPLPGGVEALGCSLRGPQGARPLPWGPSEGGLVLEVPALDAGEHRVLVSVRAQVEGHYQWPATRVLTEDDSVAARTSAGEIGISRP